MKIIEVLEGTRCWKGYEKKGMKTNFESVSNCVKKEDVDFCVNCGNLLFAEDLNEDLKMVPRKMGKIGPMEKLGAIVLEDQKRR